MKKADIEFMREAARTFNPPNTPKVQNQAHEPITKPTTRPTPRPERPDRSLRGQERPAHRSDFLKVPNPRPMGQAVMAAIQRPNPGLNGAFLSVPEGLSVSDLKSIP